MKRSVHKAEILSRSHFIWDLIVDKILEESETSGEIVFRILSNFLRMCPTCQDYMEIRFSGSVAYIDTYGEEMARALKEDLDSNTVKCPFCSLRHDKEIFGEDYSLWDFYGSNEIEDDMPQTESGQLWGSRP